MKRFFSLFSLIFVVALSTFAQATAKVAFLSLGGDSQSEANAKTWFQTKYDYANKSVITDFDDIKNCDVVWIHLDRIDQGRDDQYFSAEQIQKIGAFVKNGGRLLLTTQATKLVAAMGRTNGYAPNEYKSAGATYNPDTWGINAITSENKSHAIYSGLATQTLSDREGCYPLINACDKLDHNCMWKLTSDGGYNMSVDAFESATNSRVLGTWQQNTDLLFPAIVEFYPNATWKGVILACGIAAFDWNASAKHDNFTKFAANMINYVKDCNIDIQYPNGYTKTGVPEEKSADDQDNAVYKYNPTTKTAYLYDADHTKMFIRRIPKYVTFEGVRYQVIGMDPQMKEIPLKYVDLDQGGVDNRDLIWYDIDVPLNPHKYFASHVIVYVLDRDFREGHNQSGEYVISGESTNENSINVCIDSKVNILQMEDKHPLMFPGKDAAVDPYPAEHAFDVTKRIIFEREFTAGRTSTLVLPFAMTKEEADRYGTFYKFDTFDTETKELKFTRQDNGTEAREPYIFIPASSNMPDLEFSNENPKMVFRTIDGSGNEYKHTEYRNGYIFHGSFEFLKVFGQAFWNDPDYKYGEYATRIGADSPKQSAKDLGIYAYYFDEDEEDNVFVTSTEWIGMGTFRCYIQMENPEQDSTDDAVQAGAKRMSVMARFIEDNVTGISQVESSNTGKADGRVFNIMGQRIDASQPGLQIVNGKKYFNRK